MSPRITHIGLVACLSAVSVACDPIAADDPVACKERGKEIADAAIVARAQCDRLGLSGDAAICYNAASLMFLLEIEADMAACPGYDPEWVCAGLTEARLTAEYVATALPGGEPVSIALNAAAMDHAAANMPAPGTCVASRD